MQTIVYQCDTAMPAQKITELLFKIKSRENILR
jgi:hypothetical protein